MAWTSVIVIKINRNRTLRNVEGELRIRLGNPLDMESKGEIEVIPAF